MLDLLRRARDLGQGRVRLSAPGGSHLAAGSRAAGGGYQRRTRAGQPAPGRDMTAWRQLMQRRDCLGRVVDGAGTGELLRSGAALPLPAARHWLCLLLLLKLRLLLLLLNHGNHAWLLLLLPLLLWHHSCLLLLGRHHLLLPLLQHLSPHLCLPLLLEFLNEQRALRGIHALQHLALLLRQLDGVALQLNILSPLLLALVGQKQAALSQILLLLPRIHSAELLALLKTELLDVLLDDLLLALHVRGHGPWLWAGGRQNTGLLHYPAQLAHHLLLRWAPAPLLLLKGWPGELPTLLLLLPGRCRLRTALLL